MFKYTKCGYIASTYPNKSIPLLCVSQSEEMEIFRSEILFGYLESKSDFFRGSLEQKQIDLAR